MPELPEVETIRRDLQGFLRGREITDVVFFHPEVVAWPDPGTFQEVCRGRIIKEVRRRGKYLLFALGGWQMVVSLRMTGQLVVCREEEPRPPHTHTIWYLGNRQVLRFTDQRRFGRLYLTPEPDVAVLTPVGRLGIEPLEEGFTVKALATMQRAAGPARRLKSWLLDQKVIAGLGNIYTDEVLFTAGLHPLHRVAELSEQEIEQLYHSIREVLQEAIDHRGTSVRNYVDASGRAGLHQQYLRVYSREGLPCRRCGTPVRRQKTAGRSTYFCPTCQKLEVKR